MTTVTPFARARARRLFVDDAKLHPDHAGQGIERKRLVDDPAGGGRVAEDVDHVDPGRDVGEAGADRPAADERAGVARD